MKRNFLQVKQYLESQFPELRGKVTGSNYPPPPIVELLMKLMSALQLLGLAFALLGDGVFRMIGMTHVPAWYDGVSKNGVQIAIFLYLLLPQLLAKYMITGAFEIVLDDHIQVFSKIQAGRLPQYVDLIKPLVEAGLKQVQ